MNEMNEKKKRLQQAEAGVDTVTLPAIRHQVKTPSFFSDVNNNRHKKSQQVSDSLGFSFDIYYA